MPADLTPKQKAFADYYIETGNATEAARRAGYSKKTAKETGYENLTKPHIAAYIKERMAEVEANRVATADEVVRFFTSVMRGEVKDQFGFDAQITDRLNAGKELMKRYERLEGTSVGNNSDLLQSLFDLERRNPNNGD